jgi:hypothetical protein
MKERPILFSAPMVRAILEGRKTQTRRTVKPQPAKSTVSESGVIEPHSGTWYEHGALDGNTQVWKCPFGVTGDRLWVREAWQTYLVWDCIAPSKLPTNTQIQYPATWEWASKKRSSIHMPRWASRITLDVTDVRVQRLQEISQKDAAAEGFGVAFGPGHFSRAFDSYWDEIHGAGAWDANPWVWCISFQQVTT